MTGTSPTPRRVATPSWLDLRLVLGVVLVLVAVLVGAVVFSRADRRYPVVVAGRDLAAGTVLHQDDLRMAQVQVPGRDSVYVTELTSAVGRRLTRPVQAGELVPAGAVAAVRPSTTVTVPFAAGNAPELRPGQRIEIWVSSPSCASVVVLPQVTVQDVRADTSSSFTTSGGQDVVVSVPPTAASRIVGALAIDQAQLRAGVLAGVAAADDDGIAVPAPPAGGGLPTDLARCAGTTGAARSTGSR
jgi:hypothetical protein